MSTIGNKEKILELIKETKAGLTYNDLGIIYNKEYERKLLSGYVYLSELIKEKKIEVIRTAKVEGRKVIYRATDKKELNNGTLEQLENPIDKEIIEKFIPPFLENEMDIPFNEIQQERLKEIRSEMKDGKIKRFI